MDDSQAFAAAMKYIYDHGILTGAGWSSLLTMLVVAGRSTQKYLKPFIEKILTSLWMLLEELRITHKQMDERTKTTDETVQEIKKKVDCINGLVADLHGAYSESLKKQGN